jgi:hypothetical protein
MRCLSTRQARIRGFHLDQLRDHLNEVHEEIRHRGAATRASATRTTIGNRSAPKLAAATTATAGKDARLSPEDQSAEKDSDAAIRVSHRPPADPPSMKRFSTVACLSYTFDAVGTEVGFCMVWKSPD